MDYSTYRALADDYHQRFKRYNAAKERFLKYYFLIFHRLEVIGLANIPDGPAIIAPNHAGGYDLDLLAITYCAHPTRKVTPLIVHTWHFVNSAWGKYFIGAGLPLWTSGGLRYEYTDPYLEEGGENFPGLICIFPEGNIPTFPNRYVVDKYFPGVVRLALRYKVPIIPTAMVGFAEANPILKLIPRDKAPDDIIPFPFPLPWKLKIEFGKPIYLDAYYGCNLSKPEEYWIANEIIRVKHADLFRQHQPAILKPVDVPLQEPKHKP